MIVITGANGFIGSQLVLTLNQRGIDNLILVDNFDIAKKEANLQGCSFIEKINRDSFFEWLVDNAADVTFLFHLGARTDTTEFNFRILDSLNLSYSKSLWEICTIKNIPFLYASSAATYGLGELGFEDTHDAIPHLKPLNPYGVSKQLFDEFVLKETDTPSLWVGLKFFNVYGPFENHKGRMSSVVYHAFQQIKQTGELKLFQSHHADYKDGEQLRDFIFVADVVTVCLFIFDQYSKNQPIANGIYNLGTGIARSFNDLGKAVFAALGLQPNISYIPTPEDIRDKYQYFTEAKMAKLQSQGFTANFTTLENGVLEYVEWLEGRN